MDLTRIGTLRIHDEIHDVFYSLTHYGKTYVVDYSGIEVRFTENGVSFRGLTYTDYEWTWVHLTRRDVELVIYSSHRTTDVQKRMLHYPFVPIWHRQAKGAQVSMLELPEDLTRLIFEYL